MYKFNELRSQIYKIISEWQKLYYHIYSYSDSQTLCLIFYFFIFFFNIITLCIYFRQIHSLNVKINYYFFFYLFYILLCTYFTYNLYLIRYNVKNVLLVTFGLTAAGHATILILEQNVHKSVFVIYSHVILWADAQTVSTIINIISIKRQSCVNNVVCL